ncbi:MAG: sigma-70 family RNA polymerase sigma factor, partial [Verrucomicrobiales bacterium]|nr:sigma-70 family RNA polymerase sigma factor [Verrucomicrobiales bacterium]
ASAAALEKLCRRYWRPIYAYARRYGHSEHDSQDLTQGFFADLLLRDGIGLADPDRGRFRTFLLTAFRRFVTRQWRKASADKRAGSHTWISFEELRDAEHGLRLEDLAAPPENFYDLEWARNTFLAALERLRSEYDRAGKSTEFSRLLPFLSRSGTAEEYGSVATEFGWKPDSVAVAAHRLRRRYGELTRSEVARTVGRLDEIEDELRYLVAAIGA